MASFPQHKCRIRGVNGTGSCRRRVFSCPPSIFSNGSRGAGEEHGQLSSGICLIGGTGSCSVAAAVVEGRGDGQEWLFINVYIFSIK